MKNRQNAMRQSRTRTLIQLGGLIQKSGLMEAFDIQTGDDLQSFESRQKATQLLGFLNHCLEEIKQELTDLTSYESAGQTLLIRRTEPSTYPQNLGIDP